MSWADNLINPKVIKPSLSVESPPGYLEISKSKKAAPVVKPTQHQLDELKVKKAWEVAMSPAKQIPMTLFMNYMSGNSLQLISITMTLMLFTGPFKAILDVNTPFTGLANPKTSQDIFLAKLTFIFFQIATVAIGIYKLNSMGLIPTKEGDWLSFKEPIQYLEQVISI